MLAYFKMKRICREYAQQNLRDAEDWFAKYDAGKPHAFSREFQIKLNTAIYGEAFTDAEINDYLHPVCRPAPKTDGRQIRLNQSTITPANLTGTLWRVIRIMFPRSSSPLFPKGLN